MRKFIMIAVATAVIATPALAQVDRKASSGKQTQTKGEMQIPHCTKRLGTLAIVEPDTQ